MKLLVDAHVFDDLSQGSKTYLMGLYAAVLSLDSKDDFYFATESKSSLARELENYPNSHHLQYRFHNKFFRLGWDITGLIRKNKIDWAHFQYISPARKTCPEIVTVHDLLFLDFPEYFPQDYRLAKNFLFKRSAKRAEWVLTVSEFSKKALIEHYGLDPERIILTPNGILDFFWEEDHQVAAIASRDDLDKYILYVSRFEPRKNQLGLLEAYLKLGLWKQGIKLVYVGGTGIRTHEFQERYQALDGKIKRSILFLEDLQLPDLKWLYKNCLLFVYPSFAEGFGIPPLEALACGANVVCSNTTAMSEFRFLGERLFDPNNVEEMLHKIDFFLKNPASGNGLAIREHIKAHYSWDVAARQFLSIFS